MRTMMMTKTKTTKMLTRILTRCLDSSGERLIIVDGVISVAGLESKDNMVSEALYPSIIS